MSRIIVPQSLPPTAAHIQRAPTGGRLALKSEKATKNIIPPHFSLHLAKRKGRLVLYKRQWFRRPVMYNCTHRRERHRRFKI